tara:strand:- start:56863 stop:58326 length:1464 start_codon:yes stop_codon:yes gene_type:complete
MSRWQLVQELFEATVAMRPDERLRALRDRSDGDEELARQVEALIAADARPMPELDRDASELFERLRVDAAPENASGDSCEDLCGVSVGDYCIEEHVASGGMAHVYRATRKAAGTKRRVAVKVLREGLDTEALLRRFEREQETLARLEHEHIVAFLDCGALPDGRPFLVMEFVDGVALTAWAKSKPVVERLQLFLRVLSTVQYAHSQLVVHRDLKPSNVLVTADGVPKLVDFGVSTVLDAGQMVAAGGGPMTPVYASPEQLAGDPVTVASDVFALGVVLRELLTGDATTPVSPVDLRCVVERATAADPAERYRSVAELAEDLRRFLAREPIAMRAGSWRYRGQLFARRHRWPIVLVAAVMVSLLAGWVSADLGRRSAAQEASIGWTAHSHAKVTAGVYERWIVEMAKNSPQAAELAIVHLERELTGRVQRFPEAETLVRLTLAQLYLDRGDREQAGKHAERALQLAQTCRGVGPRDLARAEELTRLAR